MSKQLFVLCFLLTLLLGCDEQSNVEDVSLTTHTVKITLKIDPKITNDVDIPRTILDDVVEVYSVSAPVFLCEDTELKKPSFCMFDNGEKTKFKFLLKEDSRDVPCGEHNGNTLHWSLYGIHLASVINSRPQSWGTFDKSNFSANASENECDNSGFCEPYTDEMGYYSRSFLSNNIENNPKIITNYRVVLTCGDFERRVNNVRRFVKSCDNPIEMKPSKAGTNKPRITTDPRDYRLCLDPEIKNRKTNRGMIGKIGEPIG